MIVCPDCGFENIEGADLCEGCVQPLSEMSLHVPAYSVEADLLHDRIRKLNPRTPLTVTPTTTVADVLQKLVKNWVGCTVVVEGASVVGIFSERDAFMRIGVDAAEFAGRPIAEFMTRDPVTLEARNKIAFALHKMNLGGYRHIPILTDGTLTGIISVRDILGYLSERLATSANA